jgi:hypothetical protein
MGSTGACAAVVDGAGRRPAQPAARASKRIGKLGFTFLICIYILQKYELKTKMKNCRSMFASLAVAGGVSEQSSIRFDLSGSRFTVAECLTGLCR